MVQASNKKIAETIHRACGSGDIELFLSQFAGNSTVRWVAKSDDFCFGGTCKGQSGVKDAFQLKSNEFQWLSYRNFETIRSGPFVFALNGGRLRDLESHRETVLQTANILKIQNGKVVEFIEFFDSAGLRDWQNGNGYPSQLWLNPGNKQVSVSEAETTANTETVRALYDAYAENNPMLLFDALSDDVSYNSVGCLKDFRFAGPCFGREAFIKKIGVIAEDYTLEKFDVKNLIAERDMVVAHSDVAFGCKKTEKIAYTEKVDMFRFFNGQIVEHNEMFDTLDCRRCHFQDA